jgi:hypothetical protein
MYLQGCQNLFFNSYPTPLRIGNRTGTGITVVYALRVWRLRVQCRNSIPEGKLHTRVAVLRVNAGLQTMRSFFFVGCMELFLLINCDLGLMPRPSSATWPVHFFNCAKVSQLWFDGVWLLQLKANIIVCPAAKPITIIVLIQWWILVWKEWILLGSIPVYERGVIWE